MRVLLLNQFFHPDLSATSQFATDLAQDLVRAGAEVTVVAGQGRYLGGNALPAREEFGGIRIRRVATTALGKRTLFHRGADYASFYLTAGFDLARLPPFDAAIVMTTPPLIAAAAFTQALRGTPLVHWAQDVYPDIAVATGALGARSALARTMSFVSRAVLSRADCVVVLGEAMKKRVIAAGARADRVEIVPNWADAEAITPVEHGDNPLRAELLAASRPGGALRTASDDTDTCLVMYSGNMGQAHDLEALVEAARRLRERRDLRFLFIGDGVKRQLVESAARELPNVSLAPYQPREALSRSLSAGDVHLVSLSAGLEGLSEPSKLYGIMAAGRPTVFVGPAESEAACTLRRDRAGIAIPSGDVNGLVASLLELERNPELRREMGNAARAALVAHHERRIGTGKFVKILERLQAARAATRHA